jgi:hypothetical protein
VIPLTVKEMNLGRKRLTDETTRKSAGVLFDRCIRHTAFQTDRTVLHSTVSTSLLQKELVNTITEQLNGILRGQTIEASLLGRNGLFFGLFARHGCLFGLDRMHQFLETHVVLVTNRRNRRNRRNRS